MKCRVVLIAAALAGLAGPLVAQEPAYVEEMRFVRELRARRYNDLALQYLERLKQNPSPELAKELPLEIAKTRLEAAGDEADSGKRRAEYDRARGELEEFLARNPGHPRSLETRLDLAQVAVLQAKTQLSKALLAEADSRVAEGLKARTLFVEAGKQLQQVAALLDEQIKNAKDPKPEEKKKLEDDRLRAELSVGLNLFDQAQTFLNEGNTGELKARGVKIEEARKVLEKVAGQDATNPICWQAKAWLARCHHELGEPKKARQRFAEILGEGRYAAEGQRLARYFRLLVIRESPEPDEKPDDIIQEAAGRWVRDYPGFARTPEGYGVRYLLADALMKKADKAPKGKPREDLLAEARKYLRDIEQTENDFTERAKRLKITLLAEEGGFNRKVEELKHFDDCYLRTQYEIIQMEKDAQTIKDDKELEKKRKERIGTIVAALERGLKLPEAKGKTSLELNNARAMLTYYHLSAGRYEEAVKAGEEFARFDPKSGQAAMAAVYAMEAYPKLLAEKENKGAGDEELRQIRERMLGLAHYMEERWPRELAGDMARHKIGLFLIGEKKWPEAIKVLSAVTPSYNSYTFSQYQLAAAALEAEKARLEPIEGDKADGYRQRALAALQSIPEAPAGADPDTNHVYLLAKCVLAEELFKDHKHAEMEKIALALKPRLAGMRLGADAARDQALHEHFTGRVDGVLLYARWGLADAEFQAGQFAKVAELLDPLVGDFNDKKLPQLATNKQVGMAILNRDLRANMQLGKLDRVRAVIKALQAISAEGGGEGAAAVLGPLVSVIRKQVDELRRKGDEATLRKTTEGFSAILDDLTKAQDKLTPEFILLLAQNYESLEQYTKAATLLEKVPEPNDGDANAQKVYHAVQLTYARQLRLTRDPMQVAKARALMDEILGTKQKPGWGARSAGVLKEQLLLLEEEGKFGAAANLAGSLVNELVKKLEDNEMKETYFECYYHKVYATYRYGQTTHAENKAKRDEETKRAAGYVIDLVDKWGGGLGGEESARRFQDLLTREADLRAQFYQAYPNLVAGTCKSAQGLADKGKKEEGLRKAAGLILDLERNYKGMGNEGAVAKLQDLLGKEPALKEQYEALKAK
jgi:hypothetical protein